MSKSHEDPNHVYYNMRKVGIEGNYAYQENQTTLTVSDTRHVPLLNHTGNKYVAVSRFSLDMGSIPIAEIDNKSTNVSVTLEYKTQSYREYIPGMIVYNIQDLLDGFNTAFSNALTGLSGLIPLPGTITEPPKILYDAENKLFQLLVQKAYGTEPVNIYFDESSYQFFTNFVYITGIAGSTTNGKFAKFVVQDFKNNEYDATHYLLSTEGGEFTYIPDNLFLVLESAGNLPVAPESFGSADSFGANITKNIILEYIPLFDSAVSYRRKVVYNPVSNEYNLANTILMGPLRSIDMQVQYFDQFDIGVNGSKLKNIRLFPENVFTCKLLFRYAPLGVH